MGWLRYLLMGDFGQQLDLHDHEAEIAKLKQRLDSKRVPVATREALQSLQRENDELKLYVVAVLRLLIAKNVASLDEIRSLVALIDREAGAEDGRYDGEILAQAREPTKAQTHGDKGPRGDTEGHTAKDDTRAEKVAPTQSQCPACGAAIPESSARCPSCDIALT
jgi:hypothetical protein